MSLTAALFAGRVAVRRALAPVHGAPAFARLYSSEPASSGDAGMPAAAEGDAAAPAAEPASQFAQAAPGTKLFVGNLSWNLTNESLQQAFAPYGNVQEASIVYERDTMRSRGFGFVVFNSVDEAQAALAATDNMELDGRALAVRVAQARPAAQSRYNGAQRGGYSSNYGYPAQQRYSGGYQRYQSSGSSNSSYPRYNRSSDGYSRQPRSEYSRSGYSQSGNSGYSGYSGSGYSSH